MEEDSGYQINKMAVDGGAIQNDFLMQFQSDLIGKPVERPLVRESTAIGAAFLAGLAVGFWRNKEELISLRKVERSFIPTMSDQQREELFSGWLRAVKAAMAFCE